MQIGGRYSMLRHCRDMNRPERVLRLGDTMVGSLRRVYHALVAAAYQYRRQITQPTAVMKVPFCLTGNRCSFALCIQLSWC